MGSGISSTNARVHTRENGTYAAPPKRTLPDNSIDGDWTTKGNYNPYTGTGGTKQGGSYGN
jgi:hypothetical protein